MKRFLTATETARMVANMTAAGCKPESIAEWKAGLKTGVPVQGIGALGVVVDELIFTTQLHECYFDNRQPVIMPVRRSGVI